MNGSRHESVGFFHKRTPSTGSRSVPAPGTAAAVRAGVRREPGGPAQVAGSAGTWGLPVRGRGIHLTPGCQSLLTESEPAHLEPTNQNAAQNVSSVS